MKKTHFLIFFLVFLLSQSDIFSASFKPPKKSYIATIYTRLGKIELILFDNTPRHRDNFVQLAESGFYDSTTFHRVLQNFMIQGGDPNTKPDANEKIGIGGPGYTIDAEILEGYTHVKGMLAAARKGDRMNPEKASSGSQFYIVQNEDGAHHLDNEYTIYGQVVKGIETVDAIAAEPVNGKGLPDEAIRMIVKVEKIKRKKIIKMYNYLFNDG